MDKTTTSLPIRLQPSNLRPIAYRILSKKHGLNLKTDALNILTETIGDQFGSEWKGPQSQQLMEEIVKIWKKEDRGIFIDGKGLSLVIKEVLGKSNGTLEAKAARSDTVVDSMEIDGTENIDWHDYYRVIIPPEQPSFVFDKSRKQFKLVLNDNKISANLSSSIKFYSNRYNLILDRCSRNESFQKPSFASISALNTSLNKEGTSSEITLIKNMLGRDGSKFILLGLLSKNNNDDFIIEDQTDYIELNLSQAFKTQGSFYCTGMFVVVEGIYSASGGTPLSISYLGGCFHVSNITQPPAERRDISLENYGNIDFLGISQELKSSDSYALNSITKINKSFKKKLVSLEKTLIENKIIMVGSDCFLDNNKVLEGLNKLFLKLEASLEDQNDNFLAIVFTGSFTSTPLSSTNSILSDVSNSEIYKDNFDNLAKILAGYSNLVRSTKFIFIPGKNDPWQSTCSLGGSNLDLLPQKSIPKFFMSRLERLIPKGNLILGWNPTRINYLTQEIVFFKDDLVNKLKRNDIIFPSEIELENERLDKDQESCIPENINTSEKHLPTKIRQARKLVKTILDQGTLLPFLKDLKVINPRFDYSLRIEPLPTIIVLNDSSFENFEVTYNGCKVINVTSILNGPRLLNYVTYTPSSKKFDFEEVFF
ncbi:uncharacterized protein PRCAT00004391001 [Priceomyces carsonii]|uniref:uncharacterized protein n=1 Tax=Priceomyces carsonii TaxID=28549 RepID=UPI002EDA0891|nr:unnamed protein product [Priceomyces carsonii]